MARAEEDGLLPQPGARGSAPVRFGPDARFELQPAERRLLVDGQPAALGARALDVLIALAAQPDHLLTKNELLDRVWPGLVVEETTCRCRSQPAQAARRRRHRHGAGPRLSLHRRSRRRGRPIAAPALQARRPARGRRPTCRPSWRRCTAARTMSRACAAGGDASAGHRRRRRRHRQDAGRSGGGACCSASTRDGVWLVELAPLADPALLCIDRRARDRRPVARARCAARRAGRRAAGEAAAAVARQLRAPAGGGEPAGARAARTHAAGAHAGHQPGAAAPARGAAVPARAARRAGRRRSRRPAGRARFRRGAAVRRARARRSIRASRSTSSNVQAVAEICRQLDGLALAIELAAARVPVLGVQGVRERLGERLRVLTAGSRIALRRHQTLRAALDWSHGLLRADERTVFRRLGVFSGGCTAEAAQQVAGRRAARRMGGARPPGRAGRQVAGRRRRRRPAALPAARERACLCAGEARRGRRDGRAGTPPRGLLRRVLPSAAPMRCWPTR